MTIEDAIREVAYARATAYDDGDIELYEGLNMAIEALEKQIPKTPNHISQLGDLLIGRCPVCNGGCNSEYDFCYECLQKLDWSDEE